MGGPGVQIRVHLAHVGLPILGDMQYLPAALRAADTPTSPPLPHPPRHALHAKQLTLTHPVDDARLMTFVAPLPADMRHTAEALGLVGVAPAGLRTSIDGWL
jgi:23S rRNA pseudouridine955/2504/2580 synthase